MKKILTFVVAILAISLSSCKKDDNKNETPNPFIGTWKLEQFIEKGVDDTNDCNQKSTAVITDNTITINSFNNNPGDCVSEKYEFTYSYTDGKISNLKKKTEGGIIDDYITFIIENNQLVVTQVYGGKTTTIEKYKKQ